MELHTGSFWHVQPRGIGLAVTSARIPDEGIPTSSSLPANGSEFSPTTVLPFPLVFIYFFFFSLAYALSGSRFGF